MHPINLRCEYLRNPLGIDVTKPNLSWNFQTQKRNQHQSAYRIIAAGSLEKIHQNIGDLWDSGKVNSDQSIHIPYSGKKLESRMQVFWKVRVWDQNNQPSDWSQIAKWEMGLLEPSDWQAKWIGESEDKNPDSQQTGPAPYFRKDFEIKKDVKSTRAYVCGLGYYELYVNDKVGDYVLAPIPTNYDRRNLRHLLYHYDDQSTTRVLYNIFDVTKHLSKGENVVGMILGNGWYNQRDRTVEGWMWYDTPRLIIQIEIDYKDGTREIVISDESWKVSTGPITYNGIFTGEFYNAGLEMDGWSRRHFDDSTWKKAQPVRAPTGRLEAQLAPPDNIVKTLRPVSVSNRSENVYIFDIGQMISGWVRLKIKGTRGTKVILRYIEEMGNDYGQKDVYILKGEGVEIFEPRFTWHAFRHVEVSGVTGSLTLDDLEGRAVNTAVDTVGHFECSNELFNKIYRNYIWTQLGNFHGSFSSDCPHRERLGYTGDGQLLVESSILNFDMAQFYRKWLNDIDDARNKVTGYVPHTAPFGGGGGGPAWGSAYVIGPWFFYQYYGDTKILQKHYSGMKHWIEYLSTRTDKDGIVVKEEPHGWCLGDWAAPGKVEIPPPLVNTCYYYYLAHIMSNVANILDKAEDSVYFSDLANKIRIAVNKKFFDKENNKYWTSRQGADVFPLAFGMVPKNHISDVLESMIDNILKNNGHFDTGILATPLMLEVLTKYGREDIAFTLMNQRDYPGFGDYIIGKGATTLWENWDGKGSHSHPMYGSVIRWFFKALAGINPDPQAPGFKHTIIKPTICGDLTHARAEYNSIYGKISSEWKLKNENLYLNVEIPPNTTATVFVPATDIKHVTEIGEKTKDKKSALFVKMKKSAAVFEIGSGKYKFVSHRVRDLTRPVHVSTPIIFPRDSLFVKPQTAIISIQSATKDAQIYFTLDGSEPTRKSIKYDQPFELKQSILVKAKAFKPGFIPSFIKTNVVNFVDPNENGLDYTVYIGEWDEKPDLQNMTPVSSGRVYQFDVKQIKKREDHIAIIFEGFIEIDTAGEYTFYCSANDGSLLYIDETLVVDNAGYYGDRVDKGKIQLEKGRHFIKVLYYENTGTESIDVLIEGPGLLKQPVPPFKLFFDNRNDAQQR